MGIYARGLSGKGGVKQYIDSMCRALIKSLSYSDELYIFHNIDSLYFQSDKPNVHEVLLGSKNKLICDYIIGPKLINKMNLDAVWFTKYIVPFGVKAKTITTVHDMAYFMPALNAYTLKDTIYMRIAIRNSCSRADKIVAVSENTKQDIINILPVNEEKICVIHEAADTRFRVFENREEVESFRKRMSLPRRFVLFTGGISPRKNLIRLFEAFKDVSRATDCKLVLTGNKGWRNKDILSFLQGREDIVRIGFVQDEDMPALYNAAEVFVYPSLYEGFGLPIIEAACCGTPVVCARGSSLTEVGGDGVLFVDPKDTKDIARKIILLLNNREESQALIKKGFANAERFSWDKSAAQLSELATQLLPH